MNHRVMKLGLSKCILFVSLFFLSCSTMQSSKVEEDLSSIKSAQPFILKIFTTDPLIEQLLKLYIPQYFDSLEINENGKGSIEFNFATQSQSNAYGHWQNSIALMFIKDANGKLLWSAEYTYKGGMELASFAGISPAEAARTVTQRLADQFNSDFQ